MEQNKELHSYDHLTSISLRHGVIFMETSNLVQVLFIVYFLEEFMQLQRSD